MQNKYFLSLLTLLISQTTLAFTPPPEFRYWASAEYIYWWSNNSSISAPLATQNNSGALPIIGTPGTQIILGKGSGSDSFDFDWTGGARVTFGGWFDDVYCNGLEVSGFGLTPKTEKLIASGIVDTPFFSTLTSSENVLVGGRPNTILDSDTFQPSSLELNALHRIARPMRFPLIVTAGIRYMNIDEKLVLNDAILDTPTLPPGAVLNIEDKFTSRNHFFGLQMGARTNYEYCNFYFEGAAEIALGVNYQRLIIQGQTNVNETVILQPIGLFAEPTNIGNHRNSEWAILPELKVKAGYNFYSFARPFISYSLLYMNNVLRSANQIDRNINQSQNPLLGGSGILTGAPAPVSHLRQSNLWLHGIGIGIDFG